MPPHYNYHGSSKALQSWEGRGASEHEASEPFHSGVGSAGVGRIVPAAIQGGEGGCSQKQREGIVHKLGIFNLIAYLEEQSLNEFRF